MNININLKSLIKKYYPFIAIIIFAITTCFIMFSRVPFWDEAHQIDIARLGWFEILKITRVIGHPFLWYYIIKPFSDPHLYPYSIYIINWIFCICSIILLWKRAPFNYLIKTLITFSVPFLYFFAPVSRCYSIGILLLFLLCTLYPVKTRHPYIYSSLIVICSNTSAVAMVGCFYLGVIFLFDLYKKKNKALKNVLIIFFICAILIMAQYTGTKKPYRIEESDFIYRLIYFVILPMGANVQSFLLHLFSSIMFYIFPFYCFRKSKSALFFLFSIFITLSIIFIFEYGGSYWNHYFYYIYFIMTFWIFYKKLYKNKIIKILFALILFMFCFRSAIFSDIIDFAYNSHSKEIAEEISKNNEIKNSKLYILNGWSDISPGADIYLLKENVCLYDIHNRKKTSYESLRDIYFLAYENINFDNLYKNMDSESYIVTNQPFSNNKFIDLTSQEENNDYIVKTKEKTYYIKNVLLRKDIGLYIYKPTDITSYGRINLWN